MRANKSEQATAADALRARLTGTLDTGERRGREGFFSEGIEVGWPMIRGALIKACYGNKDFCMVGGDKT